MSHEFKLPELGENVEEGDVLKVLVKPGDTVEKEQAVVEIETDKAVVEVPVDASGRVESVEVNEGDTIRVGQVLLVLSVDGAGESKEAEPAEAEAREKAPSEAEPDHEDEGEPEEPIEPTSEDEGAEEVDRDDEKEEAPREREPPARAAAASVPAAPSVRRLARELGVDIEAVDGSGPGGRISMDDVKSAAKAVVATGTGGARKLPDFEKWGTVRRERLSGLRRAAARQLARSWSQIPHVTHHDDADVTRLDRSMREHAERVEKAGAKLTLTAVAVYVAARALKKFPGFNASLDIAAEELVVKEYRHVGVAVDTERGLVVPVVRNADRMSLTEIALNVAALAEQAREGKLAPEDMEGGTFTVTNLGGIGGTSFTPIVNWPEVAILGLSRARRQPVWQDGDFEPHLVLPLSLSYDHRVIDGADAARCLRFIASVLEDPFLLALEGDGP